jgi:hypothetical protein
MTQVILAPVSLEQPLPLVGAAEILVAAVGAPTA